MLNYEALVSEVEDLIDSGRSRSYALNYIAGNAAFGGLVSEGGLSLLEAATVIEVSEKKPYEWPKTRYTTYNHVIRGYAESVIRRELEERLNQSG